MKQVFLDQGSQDWYEMRRTKIGASMSSALLGKHPFKTRKDVYEEMVLGKAPYITDLMKRGSDLEPEARDYYNQQNLTYYKPAVFINDSYPYLMASLDGWDDTSLSVLEIKTPGIKVLHQCMMGHPPIYWKYQIQHQLLVTGAETGTLFVWSGSPDESYTFVYTRDQLMMEEIDAACKKFYYENLLQFNSPKEKGEEYESDEDEDFKELLRQYVMARELRKQYTELEEVFKEQIVSKCEGKSKRSGKVLIERTEVKGRVEYEKIPELEKVDLEPYRKPTTVRWQIRAIAQEEENPSKE